MGVDFSGGALLQYKADKPFALDEVRTALQNNGFPGVDLQEVTGENRLIVKIKKSEEKVGNLSEQITAVLPRNRPTKVSPWKANRRSAPRLLPIFAARRSYRSSFP